jgi:uncharacterized protein (DUF433 family)
VWCFAGAGLQAASLFECPEYGGTIDEFLEWFPDLDPEKAHLVLEFARRSLEEQRAARTELERGRLYREWWRRSGYTHLNLGPLGGLAKTVTGRDRCDSFVRWGWEY